MAIKSGRVGVARSDVDELGHITVGGLTPEERAKLEKALVVPVSAPLEKEIVGVGTANEQIMFKLGDGLSIDGDTSPFTLKASSGDAWETVFENSSGATTGFNVNIVAGKRYRVTFFVYSSSTIKHYKEIEFYVPVGFTDKFLSDMTYCIPYSDAIEIYTCVVGSNGNMGTNPAFAVINNNKATIKTDGTVSLVSGGIKITKIERN